jgi:hypothetical protein
MKKLLPPNKPAISFLTISLVVVLSGCAGNSKKAAIPGTINVEYTKSIFGEEASLKEIPTDVRIVTKEQTKNNAAMQIGLNILTGGFGFQGFSKNEFAGNTIITKSPTDNLNNPISDAFVGRLQKLVDTTIESSPELLSKAWKEPIYVSNGSARLIYDKLDSDADNRFTLNDDLVIYKTKESNGLFSYRSSSVDCSTKSEAMNLSTWQANNYLLVKTKLDQSRNNCEKLVLEQLPEMLTD